VGASEPIQVDVRVIAATNRDPEKAIRQGRLREDLYYRLNVFQIDVPPLRERGDDILMLAEHFLNEFNARESVNKRWSERALRRLQNYGWPGNVRELRNVVERAALLSGDVIDDPGLPEGSLDLTAAPGNGNSLVVRVGSPLSEVERTMILATLRQVRGDKREAARRLGISLKTLYNRLSVYQAAGQMEVADRPNP
jgi:DNA-binding NtrC family response regulator